MCLVIKDGSKITTAKNDIKVYKLIKKHWNYWNPMYQQEDIRFKYGKLIRALDKYLKPINKLNIRFAIDCSIVFEGFHSRVLKNSHITNTICIIPKGSQICYGDNNDIVSTQLIVFKNHLQYLMYKLKRIL